MPASVLVKREGGVSALRPHRVALKAGRELRGRPLALLEAALTYLGVGWSVALVKLFHRDIGDNLVPVGFAYEALKKPGKPSKAPMLLTLV